MSRLRFGILGAGRIAGAFADGVRQSARAGVVAVGSRSKEKADAFAKQHEIERACGSYDELLAAPRVDAIYVATPNSVHKENVIAALRAGKHVLCEKPMATSEADAREMFEEAAKHKVVLLEGFPFRFQPQTIEVLRRIRVGEFGDIKTATAGFGFMLGNPTDVRWDACLGGGSLWDVGVYPISLLRAVFGQRPRGIRASARWAATGVDLSAHALFEYPDGRAASVWCSFETSSFRRAHVVGSIGLVDFSYTNSSDNAEASAYFVKFGADTALSRADAPFGNGFSLEADGFAAAVAGEPHTGATSEETIDNIATVEEILRVARGG